VKYNQPCTAVSHNTSPPPPYWQSLCPQAIKHAQPKTVNVPGFARIETPKNSKTPAHKPARQALPALDPNPAIPPPARSPPSLNHLQR